MNHDPRCSTKTMLRMGIVMLLMSLPVRGWATSLDRHQQEDARLAGLLSVEGDHRGAAVEFRRLGMYALAPEQQAGFYWSAAHQYWLAGDLRMADRMLDQVEERWSGLDHEVSLLRAEITATGRHYIQSAFYWQRFLDRSEQPDQERFARHRLAGIHTRQGDLERAVEVLSRHDDVDQKALHAIREYQAGRDKKPVVGGLLGLIPGMGFAYAGEYGNALRSLILNSLFIYGMVHTAERDQWGGFAVITFFELTWYSGSIYGGVDAAHRYNRRRLEDALSDVEGKASFAPVWEHLPVVSLNVTF